MTIDCCYCGKRNASEFKYLGEDRARPSGGDVGPAEWRRYLYQRNNAAGWTTEHWLHSAGCRRFLTVERHTVTNEIRAVRPTSPTAQQASESGAVE